MGDVTISAFLNVVLGRLITPEYSHEYGPLWRFKEDILSIKNHFEQIKYFVHDAEEKRSREEKVDSWLKSLKSAIQLVQDDILTEAMLQSVYNERGIRSRVRTFFSTDHNQFMFRHRIARKVKHIRGMLDGIASQISVLCLTSGDTSHVDLDVEGKMPHRETSSIFGRRNDLKIVIEKICNKDIGKQETGEIRVYGIWGIRGVGKTTLAKSVYKHKSVNKDFKLKYWVHVGEIIQVKEIMIKIIKEIDSGKCELTHIDALQSYLQRKLSGKKFLLVLDDVRIEDSVQWDLLSETLRGGTEESIVMITTQSEISFGIMAKDPKLQYRLGPLSKDDSWLLFRRVAFEGRDVDDIRELQPIGWKIVKKCEGVPLTVINLARLMQSKRSKYAWMNVMKNNIQGLLGAEIFQEDVTSLQKDVALHDLKSSYYSLLPHLKRCFAYCYLFPKGHDIERDVAVQLWVVNNFIPPKGKKDLYVLGEEIFGYLVQKSLFQVVKDKKYSSCRFKVHNLMHDHMAKEVMEDYFFVRKRETTEEEKEEDLIPVPVIHWSSSCPGFPFPTQDSRKQTSVRSILVFGKITEGCFSQIFNHACLTVLYLCGIGLKELPDSICKLRNLEYLNLSYSSIQLLPESIFYLQNLQMLLLNYCYELYKLPEGLRHMRSLRLLDVTSCHSLRHLPSGIQALTNIRRLPRFHVGKRIGAATLEELGDLNHLEGELEISGLENVGDLSKAKTAKLTDKTNLSVLKLSWSNIDLRESNREMLAYDVNVLEGLEPNPSLKGLHVYFYMGETFSPKWMSNLKFLVEIGLSGCTRCKGIPPLGTLHKLRVIKLVGMNSLEGFHIDDFSKETDIFPCLQELHIFLCPRLVFLPSKLPQLQVLRLVECGALTSLPAEICKRLKELEISGCQHLSKRYKDNKCVDWHKISHIPKRRIDSPVTSDVEVEDEDEDDSDE